MAPISKNVIALLTTMLEYMQANPDDNDETEALIKSTLQAISGAKRSSIRRLGDSFLDFADERPAVALACVLFIVSLNPVGLVTTIAEQYGWIQPRKVQIEVKEPVTGSYRPADIDTLQNLASKQHITQGDINVGIGQQIAIQGFGQGIQECHEIDFETTGGNRFTLVRHDRSSEPWRHLQWDDSGRNRWSLSTDGPAFDAAERTVRRIGKLPGSLIERARNER